MQRIKASIIVVLPVIITFVIGIITVNAKSMEYVLNYGASQAESFIKYNCENDVHSAIWSYDMYGAKKISVKTSLQKKKFLSYSEIDKSSDIIEKEEAGYGASFENTGGGDLKIVWTNISKGTKLRAKFFLNNGLN